MKEKDFEDKLRNIKISLHHDNHSPLYPNHTHSNIVTVPIKIIPRERIYCNEIPNQKMTLENTDYKDVNSIPSTMQQTIKQKHIIFTSTDVIKKNRMSANDNNPMTSQIPKPIFNQPISSKSIIHISCEKTIYHRKKTQDHQRQWTPQITERNNQRYETSSQSQNRLDKEFESQEKWTMRTTDRRSSTTTDMTAVNPGTFFKNKNTPMTLKRQNMKAGTNMTMTSADTKIEIPLLITESVLLNNGDERKKKEIDEDNKMIISNDKTDNALFDEHIKNLAQIQSHYEQMKKVIPNEAVKGIKGIKIQTIKGSQLIRHNLKKINMKLNNQAKLKEKLKKIPISQYKNGSSTLFKKYCTNYSFKTKKDNEKIDINSSANGNNNNNESHNDTIIKSHNQSNAKEGSISDQHILKTDTTATITSTTTIKQNKNSSLTDNSNVDVKDQEFRTITISPPINIFNIISNQSPQSHIQATSTDMIDKQEIIITSTSAMPQTNNGQNPLHSFHYESYNTIDKSSPSVKKRYNDQITNKEVLANFLANNTKAINSFTHSRNSGSPINNNSSFQSTSSIILQTEPLTSFNNKDDCSNLFYNYSLVNPHNCFSEINSKDIMTEEAENFCSTKQQQLNKSKEILQSTSNTKIPSNPLVYLNNSFLDQAAQCTPISHRAMNRNKHRYLATCHPNNKAGEIKSSQYDNSKDKKLQNMSFGEKIEAHEHYLSETLNTCIDDIEKKERKQELYQRAFGKVDYKSFEIKHFAKVGEYFNYNTLTKLDIKKKNGGGL